MLGFKPQSSDWLASLAHWRFQDWNLNLFNPYWHSEAVWCPPITRNNAVAESNAWLSPPGNLAGQAWNYQLQMIDKTLIRRALPVWYAAPTPAVTAKETDTQKAKVFLTSAFGIRFAWLPSPNSILWLYSSVGISRHSSTERRTFSNGWTEGTTTATEMTKTHNGSSASIQTIRTQILP